MLDDWKTRETFDLVMKSLIFHWNANQSFFSIWPVIKKNSLFKMTLHKHTYKPSTYKHVIDVLKMFQVTVMKTLSMIKTLNTCE